MKKEIKFTRSQILTFGSFLVLVGVIVLSYGHLRELKEEIYEQVKLSLIDNSDNSEIKEEIVNDSTAVRNVNSDTGTNENNNNNNNQTSAPQTYSYHYVGYLQIPKIGLKRGFLDKNDRYNDIEHNITVSNQAVYPDSNGNFILMAHSGYGYIAFFAKLYKLRIGDYAYVTYNGVKYKYQLVKIEEQEKTGLIAIHRPNYNVNGLTLITCTKDSDTLQSIYIFELV